jgi:hypothetical protein
MKSVLTAAGVLILAGSCIVDDDPPTKTVAQQAQGCPWAFCGNTPKLGNVFHELDMTMRAFSPLGAYRIKSFRKGGIDLTLIVEGFHVIGKTAGGLVWTDVQLKDAVLVIEPKDGTSLFEVKIADVSSITYYEGGNDGTTIPTFKLTYEQVVGNNRGPTEFVCPQGSVSTIDRHALLFTGDRYDPVKGDVIAMGDATTYPWFNVACNDDSVWKAALMRHVWAARGLGFETDQNDHTTAVRAIRADYCGNGHAYTQLGTQVDWANRGGWLTLGSGLMVEAIWDQNGAACLRNPRLASIDSKSLGCEIRLCTSDDVSDWIANGYRFYTKVPP